MSEATIDELRIEVEAEAQQATGSLEQLIKQLEKLKSAVAEITEKSGINTLKKQISKLTEAVQSVQNTSGVEKITQLVEAVKGLDKLNDINSEGVNAAVSAINKLRKATSQLSEMQTFDMQWIQQLADVIKPFENANTQGFADFLKSLKNLPSVSERLGAMDFEQFTRQMEEFAAAIEPAARQLESISEALGNLPDSAGEFIGSLGNITPAANRANTSAHGLSITLGDLKAKTVAAVAAIGTLVDKLSDCVNISNQFVENLNLFSVTMGESAAEAYEFAEAVNEALGIDTSDWVRYQGFFQSIGKGFGIVTEKADLMSQNLTQLSYDISSFYNTSVDEAYNKVVSGISGELEPLRRYGFALDEATLKQVAYEHGITQSVEAMTQAQKAQLRYVAILEQAGNIGILGDMSRTIDNSANQLRILEARLEQFARAVGNMVMPILSEILPYLTAFIQLLTEGAQAIADFLGFELPKIDLNTASVTSGYDDITEATNAAAEATEAFKGSLAGVDQLNIIGSTNDSAGDTTGLNFDLDIDLPTYDFLGDAESKTKEIFEGMKQGINEIMPLIEMLGAALAGLGIITLFDKVSAFASGGSLTLISRAGKIFSGAGTGVEKFAVGLSGGLASMFLWKNAAKGLTDGTKSFSETIATALPLTVAIGAALSAAMGPVGWLVTGVGTLAGALWGVIEAQNEANAAIADSIVYADRGGISISTLADGMCDYFNTITDGYEDILNDTQAFQNNQKAIEDAKNEIGYLIDKYQALGGEITSEDAEAIETNLEKIATAVEENLGTATQDIIDSLITKFKTFVTSMGNDVDDMIAKFYVLGSMGNTAVAENKQRADELVAKIQSDGGTEADWQELRERVAAMSASSSTTTAKTVEFEQMLAGFDYAGIDFNSEEAVQNAFSQVSASAENARETIKSAWAEQELMIRDYKSQLEALGVDKKFDAKFGAGEFDKLFADTTAAMNASYQDDLDKIDAGMATFAAMAQNELNARITEAIEQTDVSMTDTLGSIWSEWWSRGLGYDMDSAIYRERQNKANRVTGQYSDVQSVITDFIGDNSLNMDGMYDAAAYCMEGLANGVYDNAGDFLSAVIAVANEGVAAFESANEIHSPSKVYAELGGYIDAGLANGIRDNASVVIFAIDELYRQMIAEAEKYLSDFDEKADVMRAFATLDSYMSGAAFSGVDENALTPSVSGEATGAWWREISAAAADAGDEERPINITLYSTVEMDGDAVGEAVSQYNDRQAYVTNGGRSR